MNQPSKDTLSIVDDIRIEDIQPIITPKHLIDQFPLDAQTAKFIETSRQIVSDIVHTTDPRLLVITGPCSIHNTDEALEYASRLKNIQKKYENVFLVMRTYFEKPRTTVGWKGLINDPYLDDSCDMNEGLKRARKLLLEINQMSIPTAVEFLDILTPQYIADLVSWGAIGARTTESQEHRKLVSGLSMPVGFKNGTDGNIQIAIDAIGSAQGSHTFIAATKQGRIAQVKTSWNQDGHIILRGSSSWPNYRSEHVRTVVEKMDAKNIQTGIIIDASHGNSEKNHRNQPKVSANISEQITAGNKKIIGIMIEGNLNEWNQKLSENLKPWVSITDACVDWDTNKVMIDELDRAAWARIGKEKIGI